MARHRDDDLLAAFDGHDARRGPGADPGFRGGACIVSAVGLIGLPETVSVLEIDRGDEAARAWAAIHEDRIAVNDRRAGVAPDVPDCAQIAFPQLVAGVIVAIEAGGAVPDDDVFAVGGGR